MTPADYAAAYAAGLGVEFIEDGLGPKEMWGPRMTWEKLPAIVARMASNNYFTTCVSHYSEEEEAEVRRLTEQDMRGRLRALGLL